MSIKSWITKKIVKKYAGSWIRGGLRIAAGWLAANGVADAELAEAFTGSAAEILINSLELLVDSPELVASLSFAGISQWWSLKEKKDKEKE
jgi:hypothetical protein